MSLSVMEVAIYVMVLTAGEPKPYECVAVFPDGGVNCTNGIAAQPSDGGAMKFSNGVTVTVTRDRALVFSNGIRIHMDASAWAHFTRGGTTILSARRADPKGKHFTFNNGYACDLISGERELARCFKML